MLIPRKTLKELLAVEPNEWQKELEGQHKFFETLQPDLPDELSAQREKVAARFGV